MYLSTPDAQWSILVITDTTSKVACVSTYFPSWMSWKTWSDFNLCSHIVFSNRHCVVFNSYPVRPQEGHLYWGSSPSSLTEADSSHEVMYIISFLLCRKELYKTHKRTHVKDTWRFKYGNDERTSKPILSISKIYRHRTRGLLNEDLEVHFYYPPKKTDQQISADFNSFLTISCINKKPNKPTLYY